MNILDNLNRENAHVEELKSKIFKVVKKPLVVLDEGFNNPDNFALYKEKGGDPLGVVGSKFHATQPEKLLSALEIACIENGFDASKINYKEFKGGKKVSFSIPAKTFSFKNFAGKEDQTTMYINIMTGFDGLTKTTIFVSSFRMNCLNQLKALKSEYFTNFKNTKGNKDKATLTIDNFSKVIDRTSKLQELYQKLDKIQINKKMLEDYVEKVMGYNSKTEDLSTIKKNNLRKLAGAFETETARTGTTLWGLVNTFSYYTNHIATTKDRDDYLYTSTGVNSGVKLNDRAQKAAFELAGF